MKLVSTVKMIYVEHHDLVKPDTAAVFELISNMTASAEA